MLYRPCDACFPIAGVCAEEFLRTVGEGNFYHAAEGTFLSKHAIMSMRGYNLVGPPSGCHLNSKLVFGSGLFVEGIRNVIGEGPLRLVGISESRLQDFFSNFFSIDVENIYAQSCGHPFDGGNFFVVLHGSDEEACSICCPAILTVIDLAGDHWRIGSGNPLRLIPAGIIKRLNAFADESLSGIGIERYH